MELRKVIELQPGWLTANGRRLFGHASVYINKVVDGITYQSRHLVTVDFERNGETKNECSGLLTLSFDMNPDPLSQVVGYTTMLYGVEGQPIALTRVEDGEKYIFQAGGFDTDACDDIFMNAGQWSWWEVIEHGG